MTESVYTFDVADVATAGHSGIYADQVQVFRRALMPQPLLRLHDEDDLLREDPLTPAAVVFHTGGMASMSLYRDADFLVASRVTSHRVMGVAAGNAFAGMFGEPEVGAVRLYLGSLVADAARTKAPRGLCVLGWTVGPSQGGTAARTLAGTSPFALPAARAAEVNFDALDAALDSLEAGRGVSCSDTLRKMANAATAEASADLDDAGIARWAERLAKEAEGLAE